MRRLFSLILIFLLFTSQVFGSGNVLMFNPVFTANTTTYTGITAATHRMAWRFYASNTSPITDADFFCDIGGAVTGITFRIQIQGDSSGIPDGVNKGGTVNFTGPSSDSWIGLKTLSSNTGTLTLNTPYWIVVDVVSGTPSSTNYIRFNRDATVNRFELMRHYNGTNWTTTSAQSGPAAIVLKHLDATYSGYGTRGASAASGYTDIFSTNKQGLKLKFGAQVKIIGVQARIDKTGSPGAMTVRIYEGSTEKYSTTKAAIDIGDNVEGFYFFETPVLLSANTDIYIIFEQAGTSDSNDYDIACYTSNATYKSVSLPANWTFVKGTGTDPTAFTVVDNKVPFIVPYITDPATDIDETTCPSCSGGGARIENATLQNMVIN